MGTDNNSCFFSIIIPAYNVSTYIENTINSILDQDFHDYELILIDDGSSDGTADICKKAAALHPDHIVFVGCDHRGASTARNEGLARATGEYVMFVDGDDYLVAGALAHLYTVLRIGYPELLCFAFTRTENMHENPVTEGEYTENCVFLSAYEAIAWKLGEKTIPCYASCTKNTLIQSHSIRFDEDLTYVEDALFLFRCMLASGSIWRWDNILYMYLQRPGSATHLSYVPLSVTRMELKAWKKIRHLVHYDHSLLHLVNRRMRPIQKNYMRKCVKALLVFLHLFHPFNNFYSFLKHFSDRLRCRRVTTDRKASDR